MNICGVLVKMSKGTLCDKHGNDLVKKSANKILRMVRTCASCLDNFRSGEESLCEYHNGRFDAWESKQLASLRGKCEACAEGEP